MCLHLSNHHISLLYTGTFQQNVSRRTSMSLLFSPLSRAASEAMTGIESSPKNSSIGGGGGDGGNSGNDNNNVIRVAGYFNTTSVIDAIQFKFNTGQIQGGTIDLFGVV